MSAGQLSEGANTIRVCVTDAAGNAGSETTSVVKDTTAPTVAVDSVSDTLIGPSDTSTDVTWHADENGAYSVRVGGASCTTGTEVESGSYTGAPAQHITTVSAGQLSEGANTIRVCVTDAAGNQGSQTTSVVKDVNPPIVAIDAVSDSLVGPAAPASDITWQASESGTYSVRVGGAGCTTGNVIASGSYGGPPEQTHHDGDRRRPERGREHDPRLRDRRGRQPRLADDDPREGHDRAHRGDRRGLRHADRAR